LVSQLVHLAVARGSPNPISSIQDTIRFPDKIHTAKMEADPGYLPAQRAITLLLATFAGLRNNLSGLARREKLRVLSGVAGEASTLKKRSGW
jgi:hypothetical protein